MVVGLLLPHTRHILELVQTVLADSETGEALEKLAFGVIGDIADAFPNGEAKEFLLVDWLGAALSTKGRYTPETKKTIRWAREVCCFWVPSYGCLFGPLLTMVLPCRLSSARLHKQSVFPCPVRAS